MTRQSDVGLPPHAEREAERLFAAQAARRRRRRLPRRLWDSLRSLVTGSPITQVIFFNDAARDFAKGWQGTDLDRWAFPVFDEGARFIYDICFRLQTAGTPAGQVLIATKGQEGAFWVAPDSAPATGEGVVGLAAGNTSPTVFGVTLAPFVATTPTLTVLSSSTAAGKNRTSLLGILAQMVKGYVPASDQAVTLSDQGTAETSGNIWVGQTDGTVIEAKKGGQPQAFPLDPYPWTTGAPLGPEDPLTPPASDSRGSKIADATRPQERKQAMSRKAAKIVSLIDVSSSMGFRNYITPAKADLNTFINMFQPSDNFAVVKFETTVNQVYPPSSGLAQVNSTTLGEVAAAVRSLQASGSTNIGDAIKMGTTLLQGESEPRAQVLLSDGEWNVGPDPLSVLPQGIRIFTIALGDDGQTGTLRQIARDTGASYLFTPDAIGLASLYFDILDYADVGRLVYSGFRSLNNVTSTFVSLVKLAGGLDSASIGVNWADPVITYVNQNPGPGQVSSLLLDPDFKIYPATPDYQEDGFAVFTIPTPKSGDWNVLTSYGGGGTANVTAGALDPDQLTTLALEAPFDAVPAGRPFTVRARITHDRQPVAGCSLAASADQPAVSLEAALLNYRSELACIELPEDMDLDHPRADRVRLRTLRHRKLPNVDILPRHECPASCREIEPGWFEIDVATLEPGEYLVKVECIGPHPNGGELMRTKRVAVSVR